MSDVGVDTIAVRLDLAEPARGAFVLDGYGRVRANGMTARVEVSLPRRWWRNNGSVVPIRLLPDAIDQLVDEVGRSIPLTPEMSDPRHVVIRRLDLARDFDGVPRPGEVLQGIASIQQPGNVTVSSWVRAGRFETVSVGNSSYHLTAYDRHRRDPTNCPAGRVRVEARLMTRKLDSTWATKHGGKIHVVADVFEDKAESLLRSLFHDHHFDACVAPDDLWGSVEALGLAPSQQYALVGFVNRTASRRPHLFGSRNTLRAYEQRVQGLRSHNPSGLTW